MSYIKQKVWYFMDNSSKGVHQHLIQTMAINADIPVIIHDSEWTGTVVYFTRYKYARKIAQEFRLEDKEIMSTEIGYNCW